LDRVHQKELQGILEEEDLLPTENKVEEACTIIGKSHLIKDIKIGLQCFNNLHQIINPTLNVILAFLGQVKMPWIKIQE
jgi:hypothetical protein